MKFAIGLMACIAIAFVFVTSPDSQPRASVDTPSVESQAITRLTSAVESLHGSIAEDRAALEDRMNAKFIAFTESLPAPTAMPIPEDLGPDVRALEAKQAELEARIAELETAKTAAAKAASASCPCPNCQCPGGACPGGQCPTAKPATAVQSVNAAPVNYSPRWQNHDGRSLRDHAVMEHGFDPNLSDAQLAAQHDAYHDQYGGNPPRMAVQYAPAMRSRTVAVQYAPAIRSRTVTVQSPYTSNCPGGVCPTTRTVQSSGGLLGFGILGRR